MNIHSGRIDAPADAAATGLMPFSSPLRASGFPRPRRSVPSAGPCAGYKSSVLRRRANALLSLETSLSEFTGPVFGHNDLGPLDNDLIRNYAKSGEPIGERHRRAWPGARRARPRRAAHAGGILASQCRRSLPPQEGHLSRAGRSQLRRLRVARYTDDNGYYYFRTIKPARIHGATMSTAGARRTSTSRYSARALRSA